MPFDFNPTLPESRVDAIFAEIRRVSDKDIVPSKRHSRDPYGLGKDWYHLAVPHNVEGYGLEPSGHIDGVWYTTFVKLRPEVDEALKPRLLWPPSGLSIIRHPINRRVWLTASGNNMIGGCTVCYIEGGDPNL